MKPEQVREHLKTLRLLVNGLPDLNDYAAGTRALDALTEHIEAEQRTRSNACAAVVIASERLERAEAELASLRTRLGEAERERDRLWATALVATLGMRPDEIAAVTRWFNEHRPDLGSAPQTEPRT